jgi:hypothetical protein
MKRPFRSLSGIGVIALLVGVLTLGFAGVASAATPPWQTSPPSQQVGGLLFFNSAGQQITGGSITTAPFAAYVEGTTAPNGSDTTATLYAYTPVNGEAPGSWSGEALGVSTVYPNSGAPAPLNTFTGPVFTGASNNKTLQTYAETYPNNDISNDGYAGLYELRLKVSDPGTLTQNYDSADISITTTNGTWSVDYSAITYTATTIALTASPNGSQTYGQSVSLSAAITPAVPDGTVQFEDNGSPIGSPVTETSGSASTTTAALGVTLPVGANTLDAVFTPAPVYSYYDSSSTATESPLGTVDYTVNPVGTATSISSTSPSSPQYAGTEVTIDATVSDDDSSTPAGIVQFEYQVGSGPETDIGSPQTVASGGTSVQTPSLPVGTDALSAVFTPTSTDYASSTATAVDYTIQTPPGDTTNTALTVVPGSGTEYSLVTLTATVTDETTSATTQAPTGGTVSFYDNGATNSNAITGGSELLETVNLANAEAGVTYPISPTGTHYVVAAFSSANLSDWANSTSAAVEYTATAAATPTPSAQNLDVDIPAGTLTITTPYSPTNPFNLGTASLNAGAGTFTASADFGSISTPQDGVTITDTGIGENTWTASAEVTNFTNGGDGANSDDINAQNLTFTGVEPAYTQGNEYGTGPGDIAVNTSNVLNGGTVFAKNATGTEGLAGEPHQFAASSAPGTGTVYVYGVLNLVAPSSVTPGEYTATLTFTIA